MFINQKINHTYKMGIVKEINIKNRTYYSYNDIIDIENFDSSLLRIDKKSYKDIFLVFNILQLIKLGIVKIFTVWIESFIFTYHPHKWIHEEENESKYLIFDSVDKNKELLKNIMMFLIELWIKLKKSAVMNVVMKKIPWNVPLTKPLKFHNMTITIRPVFKEDGKLHPQVFLDDTLYELSVCF